MIYLQQNQSVESKAGGSLLEGDYNEKESAASFQEALRAWRNDPPDPPAQRNGFWVNPADEETHKGNVPFTCFLVVSLLYSRVPNNRPPPLLLIFENFPIPPAFIPTPFYGNNEVIVNIISE